MSRQNLEPLFSLKKALNNQLTLDDFDCDSTKELKGFTQEKIPHLISIDLFFNSPLEIQENYSRGKVVCLIAASEGTFTLGFVGGNGPLNPMTLLNRNMIDHSLSTRQYKIMIKER